MDFEAIRADSCRDIISATVPNTLTSGQLSNNPKWLYHVQDAVRIDLQEQIQLLLARLQDIPSIEIVTYE